MHTWWAWVPHQASPRGSNWLLVHRSRMLLDVQVWRMFLSNLKGFIDTLGPTWEQSPSRLQSVSQGIRRRMTALSSSNAGLWISVWRQLIAKKEYREYEKCMWLVLTLNLCNLTTVVRAKLVDPHGEMRWKLFGNIIFLLSSLFKKLKKERIDCRWITN